jgi:hypothetical protein
MYCLDVRKNLDFYTNMPITIVDVFENTAGMSEIAQGAYPNLP